MSLSALPTARFDRIAPAGFALLGALEQTSRDYFDLLITSGTDGSHSGIDDPHHLGCAYDLRSHDLTSQEKQTVLLYTLELLGQPVTADGGYVTEKFFGWIEDVGGANEHFHFQLRHGVSYP